MASDFLAKGFRVIAIEANPALVESGKLRFADAIASGRLEIISGAVTDQAGDVTFYIDPAETLYASIYPEVAGRLGQETQAVRVSSIRFDDILARAEGLRYLKCDIERADRFVLEALLRADRLPKFVSVEAQTLEYAGLLLAAGYSRFKLINQARYKRWILPDPPLEGRAASFEFEMHSSGPFGDESLGEWIGFEQVAKEYIAAQELINLNSEIFNAWFDFHAALPEGQG